MTIDYAFVNWLQEMFPECIIEEEDGAPRETITKANAFICELNCLTHTLPAFPKTGAELVNIAEKMFNPHIQSIPKGEGVVGNKAFWMVADDPVNVTKRKHGTQQSRRAKHFHDLQKHCDDLHIPVPLDAQLRVEQITDAYCPPLAYIKACDDLFYRTMLYIMGSLAENLRKRPNCIVYGTLPSRKGEVEEHDVEIPGWRPEDVGMAEGSKFRSGNNYRFSHEGPAPPPVFPSAHMPGHMGAGEGEIVAVMAADLLSSWGVANKFIWANDNDYAGLAASTRNPSWLRGMYVRLKPRDYAGIHKRRKVPTPLKHGRKTQRTLDMFALASALHGSDKRRSVDGLTIAWIGVMCGTDFCEGVKGCKIKTLQKTFLRKRLRIASRSLRPDGEAEIDSNLVNKFMKESIKVSEGAQVSDGYLRSIKPIFDDAAWNIDGYWANAIKGPAPIVID